MTGQGSVETTYVRNAWYVAATSAELGRALLARTFMDEPVVLWRKQDGAPAAIEDRCCHRHLPLSLGVLEGDDIRCGYHGLRFDCSGACVEIPGQPNIPARAKVKSYPVAERWQWVWIWMGDPALADPDKIPDVWWGGHREWKMSLYAPVHLACDYRLIADNVLDATHLTYVHASSIGAGSITEVDPVVEHSDDHVLVARWVLDRPPPPAYAKAGGFAGNADRYAAVEFRPPNFCVNFANCYDPGCGGPEGDTSKSEHKVEFVAISLPTPETATSCHYFFGFSRNFGLDDVEIEAFFSKGMLAVFEEDFVILEAQQKRMTQFPHANQVDIRTDNGPVLARRLLRRRIAAEA
ncbi:MAG: Rieske 2Fe-2S domain-containing protein [Beijerinckiaceae bacterium]